MIFDAHFHIIDPHFPVYENNGFIPEPFSVHDYLAKTEGMGITGGALVSGSFQKFDQEYLIHALSLLGAGYYGVANMRYDIPDEEVDRLKACGVTGVRFNLKRGGSEEMKHLVYLSNRLYKEQGIHTELYVDGKNLPELRTVLEQIPVFSIDHLGLSREGFGEVLYWAGKGMKVKATGFGRIDMAPVDCMKQIYRVNDAALMFGTDLPSTRAPVPFAAADLELIKLHFPQEAQDKILYKNGLNWYRQNS